MSMLGQICAHIHNYFEDDPVTGKRLIYQGHYKIENGGVVLPFLTYGQYFRVFGSRFNDGVHLYGTDTLTDEEFDGVIWEMRPPKDFLDLVAEIEDWMAKYGDTMRNPYQSEDVIGVYRYTKTAAGLSTWQKAFEQQLKPYCRLP